MGGERVWGVDGKGGGGGRLDGRGRQRGLGVEQEIATKRDGTDAGKQRCRRTANSSRYCELLFSRQFFPSPLVLSLFLSFSVSVSRPAAVHNTQQLSGAKSG